MFFFFLANKVQFTAKIKTWMKNSISFHYYASFCVCVCVCDMMMVVLSKEILKTPQASRNMLEYV